MPTKKIADLPLPRVCRHPEHLAATMIVRPPGVYEHTCPGCGDKYTFVVPPEPHLSVFSQPGSTTPVEQQPGAEEHDVLAFQTAYDVERSTR